MPRYARIENDAVAEIRSFEITPDPNPAKGLDWRPCPAGEKPTFDPLAEVLTGPSYAIGKDEITETYSKRDKTAQELDADKTSAISNGLNGDAYEVLARIILALENDNRAIKAKINELASGSFPSGQAQQVTMDQLKTYIKSNLL